MGEQGFRIGRGTLDGMFTLKPLMVALDGCPGGIEADGCPGGIEVADGCPGGIEVADGCPGGIEADGCPGGIEVEVRMVEGPYEEGIM